MFAYLLQTNFFYIISVDFSMKLKCKGHRKLAMLEHRTLID